MSDTKDKLPPPSITVSGRTADPEDDPHFFPEDERSPMDWEDDHSSADFDLNAEIEARLGKEPEPEPAGLRAHDTAPPPPEPEEHQETFFPEDERSPMDWEDDHSSTDFDLTAEIEAKLGKADETPLPPAPASSPVPPNRQEPEADAPEQTFFPEDERSSMDWEDDHSTTDFDLNDEIEARLGPANAEEPQAAPGGLDDPQYVHPGLAASLRASLAYATHGLDGENDAVETDAPPAQGISEAERAEAARNTEALNVGEESCSPMDPEDSGEDNGFMPDDDVPMESPDDASASLPVAASAAPAAAVIGETTALAGDGDGKPPHGGESDEDEDEEEDDDEEDEEGEDEDDKPMTLRDHLTELRKRVFRAFLFAVGGFIVCYPFAEELFALLFRPLMKAMPEASKLIYTSPPEAFFTYMKVSFVAGIFLTSPLVFYQVWAFIAPGLYKEEKLYVVPVAFFSAFFFISGGAFCYFIVFPFAFEFFMSYNQGLIQAMPALSETLSFVLQLILAFGLIFELPLFVFFLARLGIVTADMMRRFRRYAILVMVIVAAILTPPDVLSQLLMAGPLMILYEASILIAAVFGRKREKPAEDEDDENDEEERRAGASTG